MFDFANLKKQVSDIGQEIAKVHERIESLETEREQLITAPLCRDDVLELMDQFIDSEAAGFVDKFAKNLVFQKDNGLRNYNAQQQRNSDGRDRDHVGRNPQLVTATRDTRIAPSFMDIQSNLCYFMGDQLKDGIRRAVDHIDFSDAGPPCAEREKQITKIDKEIDELRAGELRLRDEADKAGIRLDI